MSSSVSIHVSVFFAISEIGEHLAVIIEMNEMTKGIFKLFGAVSPT